MTDSLQNGKCGQARSDLRAWCTVLCESKANLTTDLTTAKGWGTTGAWIVTDVVCKRNKRFEACALTNRKEQFPLARQRRLAQRGRIANKVRFVVGHAEEMHGCESRMDDPKFHTACAESNSSVI